MSTSPTFEASWLVGPLGEAEKRLPVASVVFFVHRRCSRPVLFLMRVAHNGLLVPVTFTDTQYQILFLLLMVCSEKIMGSRRCFSSGMQNRRASSQTVCLKARCTLRQASATLGQGASCHDDARTLYERLELPRVDYG